MDRGDYYSPPFLINNNKIDKMSETNLRIRIRRDTSYNWSQINPTLLLGEQGYEVDTNKMKIGDGSNRYLDLPYFGADLDSLNGDLLSTRVKLQSVEIDLIKSLPLYEGGNIYSQQDYNIINAQTLLDLYNELEVLEEKIPEIPDNIATIEFVNEQVQIIFERIAEERRIYTEYANGLIEEERNKTLEDIENLKNLSVQKTGDTMTGNLSFINEDGYEYEIVTQESDRIAGTTRFRRNGQLLVEQYWDPEDEALKFHVSGPNEPPEGAGIELTDDYLTVNVGCNIKGDLVVLGVDILDELGKFGAGQDSAIGELKEFLNRTKYDKTGGLIHGNVEIDPDDNGSTMMLVSAAGIFGYFEPDRDEHLVTKKYVDTTTLPSDISKLRYIGTIR